jgi:multidrug efflux pump subunit AcrA (membrane-fusion protein)
LNRTTLTTPSLPFKFKNKRTIAAVFIILLGILILPWIAFTTGEGRVTALNPNERVQTITASVTGFIESWKVKEGDEVSTGDIIADLTDNDPGLIERLSREKDAAMAGLESAKLSMDTAKLNLVRQEKLFKQGLAARTEYEKSKIEFSKLSLEYSKSLTTLTKSETQLSRQSSQRVIAPRNGTITRILPGEKGQLIKAGSPIAIFTPKVTYPAVELWIEGNDASLLRKGQTAQVQFEGWPTIQIPGWPSLAIGTFPAQVFLVDQASSHQGKFRVLLIPDGKWPSQNILRLGIHARGYIKMNDSFVGKEIWRQLNGFPPVVDPIKDELNKIIFKNYDLEKKNEDYSNGSSSSY